MNNPTDLNTAIHINKCYSVLGKTVEQQRWQPWLFHHKSCDVWYFIRFPSPGNRISVLLPAFLAGKKIENLKWHFENITKRQNQLHFSFKVSKWNCFSNLDFSALKYSGWYYWNQTEMLPLPSSVGPSTMALCGQIPWFQPAPQECFNCRDV